MTHIETLMELARTGGAEVLQNEPMSRHTTFKIGGPSDVFISCDSKNIITEIIRFCWRRDIPLLVIGNGSNLLVGDRGIRGVVLKICTREISVSGTSVTCTAGTPLKALCECARDNELTGLEFAYGIPGTAGGAVYMNAGAYGGEMKDVVTSVTHIDSQGNEGCFKGGELDFGYRKSAYMGSDKIISDITVELKKGSVEDINGKMRELIERRRSKQPIDKPSAGSVFKRPPGYFAGTLIEDCGLKGSRNGGALVSEKHAGFIVNAGGATCKDVLTLINYIKQEVLTQTGVVLECEIKVTGDL